jgi:hypothetical protein
VLSELVEEAHRGYQNKIKPYVTIFLADSVRLVHMISIRTFFVKYLFILAAQLRRQFPLEREAQAAPAGGVDYPARYYTFSSSTLCYTR